MKKYIWLFVFCLCLFPGIIVHARGICEPVLDLHQAPKLEEIVKKKVYQNKEEYVNNINISCDRDGSYTDPSFNEIIANKGNKNCKKYIAKNTKYCTTVCREDAHTYFPTNIPYLSVDQYDAVLGGNHFNWEEVKTDSTIKCQTNIDYETWLADFRWKINPNNHNSPSYFIKHSLQELHQRYTDVKACDLLDFLEGKSNLTNYPPVTRSYWNTKKRNGEISTILRSLGINRSNCKGCAGGAVSTNKPVGNKTWTNSMIRNDSAVAEKIKKEYPTTQSINTIINLLETKYIEGDPAMPFPVRNPHYEYYFCVGAKNAAGNYTIYRRNDKNCTKGIDVDTREGDMRVYNQVVGVDLLNGIGLQEIKFDNYCSNVSKLPYNSEGFDIYWEDGYDGMQTKDAKPNDTYWDSAKTQEENIDEMLSALSSCNDTSKVLDDKKSEPKIKVKLNDPTKKYNREIELTPKKVTEESGTKVETKPFSANDTWWDCHIKGPEKLNEIIKTFKENLSNGKPTQIKCEKKTLKIDYPKNLNSSITQTKKTTYKFTMPKNTYNYILKTTGEAVSSDDSSAKVKNAIKKKAYIDIGYSNYPVHFKTPTEIYPIILIYKGIGWNGHFIGNKGSKKEALYECRYKVINRVVCENPPCPTPTPTSTSTPNITPPNTTNPPSGSPDIPDNPGLNVIYRPISLTNPFPGENASQMTTDVLGRTPGQNWSKEDIDKYITNNRGEEQNKIYEKTPLYSFTLGPTAIRKIRNYNKATDPDTRKTRDYDDFDLSCNKYGKRCISDFLKTIESRGVKVDRKNSLCWNQSQANFYTCANKPNQDRIKCYLSKKTKKLTCIDCNDKKNKDNQVCVDCTDSNYKNHPKCKTS